MAIKTGRAQVAAVYQRMSVPDPTAGLNLRAAPTLLAPGQARSLVNWSLEQPGALIMRPGFVAFSTTALSSNRAQGGVRAYLNTAIPNVAQTAFTLVADQGGIYLQNDDGTWNSTVPQSSGLASTGPIHFAFDRDQCAVFDGSTNPRKSTNGSSWTRFGIAASTVASTLSTAAAQSTGLSTGSFEIGFTYKDRDLAHESNGSTALSTITITASSRAQITVNIPNSSDAQVDAFVVYARNVTAGETIRRKVSSAVQSTAASSTLVISSSNWTSNDEEPSDRTPPPVLSFAVVWKNRWWARHASRRNRIHFTQIFQPQSWPSLFYVDIPFMEGDEVRALVPLGDTLLIFGTTRNFIITGQTSLDFEVRPTLDSQDGAFGPWAVAVVENGIIHAGGAGVYLFDGASDQLLSFDIEPAWRDLVKNAAVSDLQQVAVVYHKTRKEVRIAVPRRYPSGATGEFVLDLNRTRQQETPAWTETDRTIGGYIHWSGAETATGNRGRLFSWSSSEARLYEEATGTSANSSNLSAEYEGPGLTLGAHRGRWIDAAFEYEPNAGTFTVESLVDSVSQGARTLSIGAGLALYGTGLYGTATYGGAGRRQAVTMLKLGAEGRTLTQKIRYAGQAAFRVFAYHLGVVPEPRPRMFGE